MKLAKIAALSLVSLAAACSWIQYNPPSNPNASSPVSLDPMLEAPTLRSLGVYWIIRGDANKNATVTLHYRKAGELLWKRGHDLMRVQTGANDMGAPSKRQENTSLPIPKDSWLFAGSALLLDPDTQYELKVKMIDPDGPSCERVLKAHTMAEPLAPANLKTFHVVPGNGGGTGTQSDPFKGLAAANAAAKPGSLFLLHKGVYSPVALTKSGERGAPIIYRGAGDGDAIVRGESDEATKRAIDIVNQHDIWLEKLSVENAHKGIVMLDSARIVIRRCRISKTTYGINGASNEQKKNEAFFISDNVILGPSTWPRERGIEEARGIQISGRGHDVCYNYVKGFADAIDTYQGPICEAIDFHNNECELLTDDGIEMDYSERNTRCYENRITNAFQGISVQPIFGGPVYIFRNVVYNIGMEPFKIHNSPSGVYLYHNTLVKSGIPTLVLTPAEMHNFVSRNNLYVGNGPASFAAQMGLGKIVDSDWDFDGFAGGPWEKFLQWESGQKNKFTLEQVRANGPAEKHAIVIEHPEKLFASGVLAPDDVNVEAKPQDLRPAKNSEVIDKGVKIPGINDHYNGKAPDLGAYEAGEDLPHYGPRPE